MITRRRTSVDARCASCGWEPRGTIQQVDQTSQKHASDYGHTVELREHWSATVKP